MSRSFGDNIASSAGVICEPEILIFNMTDEDKFIVLASDGVWEFLDNRQVLIFSLSLGYNHDSSILQ